MLNHILLFKRYIADMMNFFAAFIFLYLDHIYSIIKRLTLKTEIIVTKA